MTRLTNWLADLYRARGWRRAVALCLLAPIVAAAMLALPLWVLYMAFTWDGR